MKAKNYHHSKFSISSNWKEEAWKKTLVPRAFSLAFGRCQGKDPGNEVVINNQGFNGIRTRDDDHDDDDDDDDDNWIFLSHQHS